MGKKPAVNLGGQTDILEGRWHELRGLVRQHWAKITEDDMLKMSGKREQLSGVIQQRYGYAKEQAETEINQFLREMEQRFAAAAPGGKP